MQQVCPWAYAICIEMFTRGLFTFSNTENLMFYLDSIGAVSSSRCRTHPEYPDSKLWLSFFVYFSRSITQRKTRNHDDAPEVILPAAAFRVLASLAACAAK